jgi:hypothetical protein
VKSRAEVIRLSVERVVEMEEFWQFMENSRETVKPGSFEASWIMSNVYAYACRYSGHQCVQRTLGAGTVRSATRGCPSNIHFAKNRGTAGLQTSHARGH